jgi:hypothetical protein
LNLLNLGLGELLGLFGAISAGVVLLYLLDRSRRRQKVSTLRFWNTAEAPSEQQRRRRIQQPWSLLLQLLSILLLLLAIAQLRFGAAGRGRDHVLLLDTSAFMAARAGRATLMDEARTAALAYVRALPATDRVMVVRAEALVTPATGFESDRRKLEAAIQSSRPSSAALHLEPALAFARKVQQLHAAEPGEIAYAGPARVRTPEAGLAAPANLRLLPVRGNPDNAGLRRIGLRRSAADPSAWEVFVSARNYGRTPRNATLALQFGGAPVGSRALTLAPDTDQEATFRFSTRAAGWLEVRLLTRDAFPLDDRAVVEVPAARRLKVAVFSPEPGLLRPIFDASPQVEAVFASPAQYAGDPGADLTVLDRFAPLTPPQGHTLWIEPPPARSPVPVRSTVSAARLERWHADNPVGAGLRTRDLLLDSAQVLAPAPGDFTVATVAAGPVIIARDAKSAKSVVLGFHPARSALRFELATPLLFANVLRWMAPDLFRRLEVQTGTVGAVSVVLDERLDPGELKVITEDGAALPYTLREQALTFFSASPGVVRVLGGDREGIYSLSLPEVGETVWAVPASVRRGVPGAAGAVSGPAEWWPWLAILGGCGLLADWLLYGRGRRVRLRTAGAGRSRAPWRKAS